MVEIKKDGLQHTSRESRSQLTGQYRQAFEAFQQISNVICKGEFLVDNARETALEFYRRFREHSSPRYSSIREEAGFGDRDNKYASGDYQKSTEIIGEIEEASSWRKASVDLLEQGRMVIDGGGGDEDNIVGWNFIKLGSYLHTKTQTGAVFQSLDVRSPHMMPLLGNATENEVRDSIKKELKKFIQRRAVSQRIKDADIPLLLNLKIVRQEVSKRGLEGTQNARFLLNELLGNFIGNRRDRDAQSNNDELTGSEILFRNFVLNHPHEKIADQLDIAYPTTYFNRRAKAIDRLTDELIIIEVFEKGEKAV